MGIGLSGLFGMVILVGDIWAIVKILGSPVQGTNKVLWVLLIVILPVLGLLIWLIAGPRSRGLPG